jgi:copper type II ascorbate-dependent monooxygenase-like protein
MQRLLGMSAILAVTVLAACGESTVSPPPPPEPPTYHRDIAPLVQEKCGGCHVEGGIAPFPLQTYEQAFTMRYAMQAAVRSRIMPPWMADSSCTDYAEDRSMSAEQIELLSRWVDEGGTEGDPADEPAAASPPPLGGLPRVDLELSMPTEYAPTQSPDEYRCFLLDWPETDVRYVTGFVAKPGRASIVHHIIAFLIRPEDVAMYQALDDAEPGAGYTCFGGPGGNRTTTSWIGGWAPGSSGGLMPPGTGIRVAPGSKIVLQIHYNLSSANSAPDRTSIALSLASSVDKVAIVQPWANPAWLQPGGMVIPAGQPDVHYRFSFDISSALSYMTGGAFQNNRPITVYGAGLHMHTKGTWARMEIERKSGGNECMLHIPHWDFHWQGSYGFVQPKVVKPGDRIAVECHWDNSLPNAKDLEWGEGTSDEMCLGSFLMTQ